MKNFVTLVTSTTLKDTMYSGRETVPAMGTLAFRKFDRLCSDHPHIFTHASSPSAEELNAFDKELTKMSYVRGMQEDGHLEEAIKKLENGFSGTIIRVQPCKEACEALKLQKRLERKTRFIHRLAQIAGAADTSLRLYDISEEAKKLKAAANAMRKASQRLNAIFENEYFLAAVNSWHSLSILVELKRNLEAGAGIVSDTEPNYPFERVRNRDTARSRQMISRVADSCYRLYGYCDKSVLEDLKNCAWLNRSDNSLDWTEIMEAALSRKVNQFNRRMPVEDYSDPGLLGDWNVVSEPWPPAMILDPPWMRA